MKVMSPLAKKDVRMAAKTDVRIAILPNYKVSIGARSSYVLCMQESMNVIVNIIYEIKGQQMNNGRKKGNKGREKMEEKVIENITVENFSQYHKYFC